MKTRPNDTHESVASRRRPGRGYALLAALWLPLQAGGPAAPAPAAAGEQRDAEPQNGPLVSPWNDSAVEGLREIRRLATDERYDAARALARGILVPHGLARVRERLDDSEVGGVLLKPVDPVLESLGWNGPPEETRAEVRYADGVVAALAGDGDAALASFERAVSLAGPGSLRLESLYDRGAVRLAGAESLRAQIPELQDPAAALAPTAPPPGAPGAPGAPVPSGAGDEEPPDFLKLARRAYEAARAALVERLRADWRDEDTRANLELIQRRLRELDELEEQRQEQQQGEEGEEGEEGDEKKEGEEGEEGEQEGEEGEEQGEGEEGEDGEGGGEDGEGPPEDSDESSDPSEEESPAESEEERKAEESEEESTDEAEESETSAEEVQPAEEEEERVLTREEVVRLLDRLREIDEQAEALRARLRQRGRVAVEKDW